jgi:hypothetical protein
MTHTQPVAVFGLALLLTLLLFRSAVRGADFPPVERLPAHPALPDPLVRFNGRRINTEEEWVKERRPELKALFQYYMYGDLPEREPIHAKVAWRDRQAFGGKATLKEVTMTFSGADAPTIQLLLAVPNARKGRAPVFLGMNFCGNHAVVRDRRVALPTGWMYDNNPGVRNHRATDAGRGTQVDTWAIEQSIDRGYAVATCYSGDVAPDYPGAREGVRVYLRKLRKIKPGPHAWGTIAAWAWGLQRCVDYLGTDPDIDAKRIAVVGHSRLGKTALLAGAFDERIALVIALQAGCGGTSPSRGKVGESVKQINTSFPHWFDGTFKEFNDHPDRLPFDQHCLIALCAPRPVLLANAVEDTWANPAGQFEMLRAAEPVYRLLGVKGLGVPKMPPVNKLVGDRLAYYIRPGKHSMTKGDWKVFLEFADRHLARVARTH